MNLMLPLLGTKLGIRRCVEHLQSKRLHLKSKSGIQILVVEDEPIIGMLIEIGCKNIEAVASIDGAMKFLADARPDFAILDVNLNGTQSYPVSALLRSRKIPFLFMSGYDAAALDAAYADVQILQKPFHIGNLNSAIDAALALNPISIAPNRGKIE
jgi:two-component SAPR family response regulator